jgi:hypothetical protein
LRHVMFGLTDEGIVALWATAEKRARVRIEHYLDEIRGVVAAVDGADLIAMGAQPGQGFSAILAQALDHRLDGRAVGRDAELANLHRLAVRAGLIPTGKGTS